MMHLHIMLYTKPTGRPWRSRSKILFYFGSTFFFLVQIVNESNLNRCWWSCRGRLTRTLFTCRCEEVDSVTVSVLIRGVSCDIGVFCGNRRPPMLMSSGPQMDVTLISRSLSVSTRGFSAYYNFVTGKLFNLFH